MKCPQGRLENDDLDCLKEECAWWDKTRDHCCVTTIGYSLAGMMYDFMHLKDDLDKLRDAILTKK